MAICGGCGADVRRTRTIFDSKTGVVVKEKCSSCAPGSFDPDWLTARGVMAWEAYPEKYDKIELPDGRTGYRAKEEWRQDTEDRIRAAYAKADEIPKEKLEQKRRNRRTTPMSEEEIRRTLERIRPVFESESARKQREYNEAMSAMNAEGLIQ